MFISAPPSKNKPAHFLDAVIRMASVLQQSAAFSLSLFSPSVSADTSDKIVIIVITVDLPSRHFRPGVHYMDWLKEQITTQMEGCLDVTHNNILRCHENSVSSPLSPSSTDSNDSALTKG